jgi:3-oxoacyl-[acyl-carrier protein] reductase
MRRVTSTFTHQINNDKRKIEGKVDFSKALNFEGKQVLVCGGSDGIGYGVACAFHQLGAAVSITGTKGRGDYDKEFYDWGYYSLDLASAESVAALSEQVASIDTLVNCVGTVLWKQGEFERNGFEWVMAVNVTGAMDLYTRLLPLLQQSGGSIISLDSVASIRPAWQNPAYSASKAALVQLTKSLAKKWGKKGVRVNTVAPGLVPTKLTQNQVGEGQEAEFAKVCPVGRFGTPEDIAGAVVYLASPLAAYVTGEQIVVDGGSSL